MNPLEREQPLNPGAAQETDAGMIRRLRHLGIAISVLLLWNGVCDLIYGYSPALGGAEYFSPAAWDVIRTAGGRPHWLVLAAQTAG